MSGDRQPEWIGLELWCWTCDGGVKIDDNNANQVRRLESGNLAINCPGCKGEMQFYELKPAQYKFKQIG